MSTVAPFGGLDPVFTPDPLAVGIPTDGDPILIDMSASITTNGMAARCRAAATLATGGPKSLISWPTGSSACW